MQNIRRIVLALTAALLALVAGSGAASAATKPFMPSPKYEPAVGASSSSGGSFAGWPQVTLSILVLVAVASIAIIVLPRLRHQAPAAA
jgi:hypothetical protein